MGALALLIDSPPHRINTAIRYEELSTPHPETDDGGAYGEGHGGEGLPKGGGGGCGLERLSRKKGATTGLDLVVVAVRKSAIHLADAASSCPAPSRGCGLEPRPLGSGAVKPAPLNINLASLGEGGRERAQQVLGLRAEGSRGASPSSLEPTQASMTTRQACRGGDSPPSRSGGRAALWSGDERRTTSAGGPRAPAAGGHSGKNEGLLRLRLLLTRRFPCLPGQDESGGRVPRPALPGLRLSLRARGGPAGHRGGLQAKVSGRRRG